MKKLTNIALFFVILSALMILLGGLLFNYYRAPLGKDKTNKEFVVEKGSSYLKIAPDLEKQNLIKSATFFKLYVKLVTPKPLEACVYELNETMSIDDILKTFEKGCTLNPDVVKFQALEGTNIEQIAKAASKVTDNNENDLIKTWDSSEFVDKMIKDYWFITESVKKEGIRHPLEGYFFPSTYELTNKNVSAEYIARKMLDQMDKVLTKHKKEIEASKYNLHEVLTLTSVVQYETGLEKDMPKVAGVFYNRLNINMRLQSSVTVCYAIGDPMHWTDCETRESANIDSPYNTYKYAGLPIGPILSFSEKALINTLNPEEHDYFYFLANPCDSSDTNTYYSENYAQHIKKQRELLTCFN